MGHGEARDSVFFVIGLAVFGGLDSTAIHQAK
jgi:hypothetical protein